MDYRIEKDTLGEVKVPASKYWGAQTERSKQNFPIGNEKMPIEIIKAFAILKNSTAQANDEFGLLEKEKEEAIALDTEEILNKRLDIHFLIINCDNCMFT